MIPVETLKAVTKIITHADCPDGIASAMILHDCLPDAEVIAVQYGPEREALEPEPGLLFCDMTPSETKVEAFVDAGAIVLDHHRGARELVERFGERGVYADADDERGVSGAWLAYREAWRPLRESDDVISETRLVGYFAHVAGVRDCWVTDSKHWHEACAQAEVLMFYPLQRWLTNHDPYLDDSERGLGADLLQRKLRHAREIAESGCLRLSPSVAIFNADGRVVSDVAEAMREVDPAVTLVAGFFYTVRDGQMLLVFSLRSSPGAATNARQVAVANGGGGHDHAAGFTVRVGSGNSADNTMRGGSGKVWGLTRSSPVEIIKSALVLAFYDPRT